MEVSLKIHIVALDKLSNGLVIKFHDGQCAFYSAVLLYDTFPQAKKLDETETAW